MPYSGRPAALSAKDAQREMLMQMMMTGQEAPPPPEPKPDMRAGRGGRPSEQRAKEEQQRAKEAQDPFTADSVDRYHLCGCSPYALLAGTGSAMLPPLDREGYRRERSEELKEKWKALPQEEKDAYGFELELLQFLTKLVGNMDQKIIDKKRKEDTLGHIDSQWARWCTCISAGRRFLGRNTRPTMRSWRLVGIFQPKEPQIKH